MSGQVTVELRDFSENAIAEITALVWRYGGTVVSRQASSVTVTAQSASALATLFAVLENDPRVISTAERDVAERGAKAAERRGAAADHISHLEAELARLRAELDKR
jgi:hypothetical protein